MKFFTVLILELFIVCIIQAKTDCKSLLANPFLEGNDALDLAILGDPFTDQSLLNNPTQAELDSLWSVVTESAYGSTNVILAKVVAIERYPCDTQVDKDCVNNMSVMESKKRRRLGSKYYFDESTMHASDIGMEEMDDSDYNTEWQDVEKVFHHEYETNTQDKTTYLSEMEKSSITPITMHNQPTNVDEDTLESGNAQKEYELEEPIQRSQVPPPTDTNSLALNISFPIKAMHVEVQSYFCGCSQFTNKTQIIRVTNLNIIQTSCFNRLLTPQIGDDVLLYLCPSMQKSDELFEAVLNPFGYSEVLKNEPYPDAIIGCGVKKDFYQECASEDEFDQCLNPAQILRNRVSSILLNEQLKKEEDETLHPDAKSMWSAELIFLDATFNSTIHDSEEFRTTMTMAIADSIDVHETQVEIIKVYEGSVVVVFAVHDIQELPSKETTAIFAKQIFHNVKANSDTGKYGIDDSQMAIRGVVYKTELQTKNPVNLIIGTVAGGGMLVAVITAFVVVRQKQHPRNSPKMHPPPPIPPKKPDYLLAENLSFDGFGGIPRPASQHALV